MAKDMNTKFLLDEDDLIGLTGYERFADQRRWLTDKRWHFEVAANGRPCVARSFAESKLGAAPEKSRTWQPNIASISRQA